MIYLLWFLDSFPKVVSHVHDKFFNSTHSLTFCEFWFICRWIKLFIRWRLFDHNPNGYFKNSSFKCNPCWIEPITIIHEFKWWRRLHNFAIVNRRKFWSVIWIGATLIFMTPHKHLLLTIRKVNGPNQIIGQACKFGISKSLYYISPTLYPISCILVMSFLIWKRKQRF